MAPSGSVNVRSFRAGAPKGGPFSYGLTRRDDVLAVLRARAGEGLHTIVNETIDVGDGGVSGVALGGLVEFAPGATPRSVEQPGTVALGHDAALRLLATVYGFTPEPTATPASGTSSASIPWSPGSARPTRSSGSGAGRAAGPDPPAGLAQRLQPLPRRQGLRPAGRRPAGAAGAGDHRGRAAGRPLPPRPAHRRRGALAAHLPGRAGPGPLPTQRGWRDPFALLAGEDPTGTAVVAVLAQEGVRARWSGAAMPAGDGRLLVEGVAGFGDDFMAARTPPVALPDAVADDVRRVGARAAAALGPVRFEWAHDGDRAWVLQLHLAEAASSGTTIHPGTPARWRRFDPSLGLEKLRELIASVDGDEGIEVAGHIGVTSHAGDLLRRAASRRGWSRPGKG